MDVSSAGVVPLRSIPDVIGLVGRRDSAAESRVLQGKDPRSIRVRVPECRGLDQNFHDVTIVDMGELPESHVSMPELSELIHKWPPVVIFLFFINFIYFTRITHALKALGVLLNSDIYIYMCTKINHTHIRYLEDTPRERKFIFI